MSKRMQGERIGNYRVIERLGAGGMGVVYRVEDLRLKRAAAIKLLPPELSQSREARARLEREAPAGLGAGSLQHPSSRAARARSRRTAGRRWSIGSATSAAQRRGPRRS